MKNNESGRSMIEMLGVLAIIGVLSVGGIWGLSEAIEKHKLNKASAQLSSIINAVAAHLTDVRVESGWVSIISYLKYKTPAILDGMPIGKLSYVPYEDIKDAFGNSIRIFSATHATQVRPYLRLSIDTGVAYCRNALLAGQQIYREYPGKFYYIVLEDNTPVTVRYYFGKSGDDFANMSVGEITKRCYNTVTADNGNFTIIFHFRNRSKS